MLGLKIDLLSLKLNTGPIKKYDKVRVSITTYPERYKEAVIIDSKNINYIHHFFQANITDETNKIVFVFRKKSFVLNDPIIATAVVNSKDFPLPNKINKSEVETFYLYEHLHDSNKKMLGEMQIQFSLVDPFPVCDCKNSNNVEKIHKPKGNSRNNILSNQFTKNTIISIFFDTSHN